ncbi:MAG: thiamine pyrophosphate-binding protein [Cyanobacteriota bacterium]
MERSSTPWPPDQDLLTAMVQGGIRTIFTVPCSVTAGWATLASQASRCGALRLQPTTHEGNLVGLAIGHWFGTGEPALIHLQNSGLANAADGLISCAGAEVFDLPLVALITWRGHDASDVSEPHQAIGRRTQALVAEVFGPEAVITGDRHGLEDPLQGLASAIRAARHGGRGVLQLSPAAFTTTSAQAVTSADDQQWWCNEATGGTSSPGTLDGSLSSAQGRDAAIAAILASHPDAAVLFSNGYTARAAQSVGDRPGNFYNVGYMGGTLAIGWSLACSRPDLEVVVVDGDQNAQMSSMKDHLPHRSPANLHWYVLDNGVGASVGAPSSLPLASAYRRLARVVKIPADPPGPFPHPRVAVPAAPGTPRSANLAPLARRFRDWIASHDS